jgi:hypothetical protein
MTFTDALRCTARLIALVAAAPAVLVCLESDASHHQQDWVPSAPEGLGDWNPDAEGYAAAADTMAASDSEAAESIIQGHEEPPVPYVRLLLRTGRYGGRVGRLYLPCVRVEALSPMHRLALARLADLVAWQRELYALCQSVVAGQQGDSLGPAQRTDAALRLRDVLSLAEGWLCGIDRQISELSSFGGRMSVEAVRHIAVLMRQRCSQLIEHAAMQRLRPRAFELDVHEIAQAAAARLARSRSAGWLDMEELPPALGDPVLVEQIFEDVLSSALSRPLTTREPRMLLRGTALDGYSAYRFIDNASLWDGATAAALLAFVPEAGTARASLLSGELALARQAATLQGGQLCVVRDSRGPESTMVCLILPAPPHPAETGDSAE